MLWLLHLLHYQCHNDVVKLWVSLSVRAIREVSLYEKLELNSKGDVYYVKRRSAEPLVHRLKSNVLLHP